MRLSIGVRLGAAVASGVPALILVSMGPVAALAGTPSVLVWCVSSVIGFLMALAFAELASCFPETSGGIGPLGAAALGPRRQKLGFLSQWTYWFGWSPALAINGILVGTYLRNALMSGAPEWTAVPLAALVLAVTAAINHFGVRPGAVLQAGLMVCAFGAIGLLLAGTLLSHGFDPGNLAPFQPPGGWLSHQGLLAVGGALFLAGWSAYGSELALCYSTEYRGRSRDAVSALLIVGLASVIAYSAIPLTLIGVLGLARIEEDPAVSLAPLLQAAESAAIWIVVLLALTLVLALNMVTISSSRLLYQMARNGAGWSMLGRLNRYGVPSAALKFDLVVNVLLLLVCLAVTGGRSANIPIALLAASNVGYFTSIILALAAAWLNHRRLHEAHHHLHIRDGLVHLGLGLAGLNAILLVCGGVVWGWDRVGVGVVVLLVTMGFMGVLTVRRRRRVRVSCLASGVIGPIPVAPGSHLTPRNVIRRLLLYSVWKPTA